MDKRTKIGFLLLCVVFIIFIGPIVGNKLIKTSVSSLDKTDRQMITDMTTFNQSLIDNGEIWPNFNVTDYPIIAINQSKWLNRFYAFNFKKTSTIGSKELTQSNQNISVSVNRYASTYPQVIPLNLAIGNFSTTGSRKTIDQNKPVFFIKYNQDNFKAMPPSNQFIIFTMHEAFHFYAQKNWPDGHPNQIDLTIDDLALLGLSYKLLDKLNQPNIKNDEVLSLLQEYVEVYEERQKMNPDYLKEEAKKEVIESTASYVGRQSGKRINKKYDILEFENGGKPTFYEVFQAMGNGEFGTDFLIDFSLYNTGNVLANSLDKINEQQWKEHLNQNTKEKSISFYDLVKTYVNDSIHQKPLEKIKVENDFNKIQEEASQLYSQINQ
ncbi:hypothetical protein [Vagococcus carniphilus]|uniref:hypothetical protein n=1 Tax=Vagococcus carniphilus TaxID=218144 RepID=UPI00288F2E55|nr:hypothetical protein [Vagococcus carniphilus]MDT2813337.1 hypothetical protein [Vagococcus carniphilus]MDT2865244.1 hypothetical protein [Vagococcus carniphilus]